MWLKKKNLQLKELIKQKEKFDQCYAELFQVTCFIRPVNPSHLQIFFRCASSKGSIPTELRDNYMINKYVKKYFPNDELIIYIIPTWEIIHLFDGTIKHTWMPLNKFLIENKLKW